MKGLYWWGNLVLRMKNHWTKGASHKKNAALLWNSSKRGGVSEAIQRFWDTFCAPTILEFWAEKGGVVDQIQNFLGAFYPGFGKIWPKKVPQMFQKKISLRKSVPKAEAPPIGQIHPFSKIAVTFEPLEGFRCPSGFRQFCIIMT